MLSWLRSRFGLDSKPQNPIDDLREQIRRDVAAGFRDEDAILQNASDVFQDELEPTLIQQEASRMLRELLAEHAEAARAWPAETDCDRLDAAFAALEAGGVISRQNFSCCQTCGSDEIWDEIKEAQTEGRPAHGYAFFHMQDTDSAVDGGGLYLNYGACEEGEKAAVAVGHEIVSALTAHGLQTDWDGSHAQRIAVSLDWKRRRNQYS